MCERLLYIAAIVGDDLLRRIMQVFRAPVVTETAPYLEHLREPCLCESTYSRKSFQKFFVLFNYSRDLRLLEHHFGNQDAVRVVRLSPQQIMPPMRTVIRVNFPPELRDRRQINFAQAESLRVFPYAWAA